MYQGSKNTRSLRGKVLDLDSRGWGAGSKAASRVGRASGFPIDVRAACDTYFTALFCLGGMYPNNGPLRSSILMSDNTKHLAKKCVKDAGPCLALCVAGAAVVLLAVLGPFDVLRNAVSLHVCMALAAAMMTGGVLDLVFWVLNPFGWKNEE